IQQSYAGHGGFKDQLTQTLGDYDRLAKNLNDNSRQIQQMLKENRPAVREFTQGTLAAIGGLVKDMQRLATGLARFAEEIERDPARLLFGDRREGYRPQ
ncbi:MAG TPA: hypothetical protein VFX03_16910, partial [Thermomicrobiales bacterium]|nr:hypothetical protein [Thermomicrobiales bacterium]